MFNPFPAPEPLLSRLAKVNFASSQSQAFTLSESDCFFLLHLLLLCIVFKDRPSSLQLCFAFAPPLLSRQQLRVYQKSLYLSTPFSNFFSL